MLDIRFVRENAERVKEASRQKGYEVDVDRVLELDQRRRELQQQADHLREKRNEIAGRMKGSKPTTELIASGKQVKIELSELEKDFSLTNEEFLAKLQQVPNIPSDDVPVGSSEDENVVIKTVGQKPQFNFQPKNHYEIAKKRNWIDKERAAKVTGSRFTYLKGDLVKLQFAIIQFTMDVLTNEGKLKEIIQKNNLQVSSKPFELILPPYMIKTDIYSAMDRLEPRDDRYKIENEDLWLQGSAEHVIGSMHADEIIDEPELPLRYLGYATSFRREAGTYGKDMEGIIRMHQFDKLEMESLSSAKTSKQEHALFVAIQEYLLQELDLPYQVVLKCTADIGKPNARGVDMETWLPGQGKYRETHTADYMTDYQTRRLKTRFKGGGGEVELAHTNDATAFALGRIMIAVIENNQNEDLSINIPNKLRPYLGARELL